MVRNAISANAKPSIAQATRAGCAHVRQSLQIKSVGLDALHQTLSKEKPSEFQGQNR